MNLANVKAFANAAKHTLIKHSPEILMGIGGVTFVATIVMACKETVEEQEILEVHEESLDYIDLMNEEEEIDDKAWKKSRRMCYLETAKKTTINYAPSVILGTTSLACFFGAFGIMKKRYATLVVAYTTLEESFRKYRERVIAARGVDEDIYYLTGEKPKEITVKGEDGKKVKVKTLTLPDGTVASPYAFKFGKYREDGERNDQWVNDPTLNMAYVTGQIGYLNNELYTRCVFDRNHNVKIRGSVFLNELRDLLGEKPNKTGSVCGWRYSNGEPGCNGYIDGHLVEAMEVDPETGNNIPCIFVNPNTDGLIFDLVGKKESKPFEPDIGHGNEWGEDIRI